MAQLPLDEATCFREAYLSLEWHACTEVAAFSRHARERLPLALGDCSPVGAAVCGE